MNQPTLFISHGAPNLALKPQHPAHRFLKNLGRELARPEAVVVVSAHWSARQPTISAVDRHTTIHDFGNFDPRLFDMRYEPAGHPALTESIAGLLRPLGEPVRLAGDRGIDHGAWIPLCLMYPGADIPVVLVAVQPQASPAYHYALGQALAPLRRQNVLVIGSGGLTHNLVGLSRYDHDDAPPDWVVRFADWVQARVAAREVEMLVNYRQQAPFARENHPTEEHFLPFFVAMGAGGLSAAGRRRHSSTTYGTVMMDMYMFS